MNAATRDSASASATPADLKKGGGVMELCAWDDAGDVNALVVTVAHKSFRGRSSGDYLKCLRPGGIIDMKSILERESFVKAGVEIWRL